jgi:dTDP-D-glucose 4,6-dehydratase
MLKNAVVVTGGSGFVGTNLIKYILDHTKLSVIDLEYRSDLRSNNFNVTYEDRYIHENIQMSDTVNIDNIFSYYRPTGVIHLATAVTPTKVPRIHRESECINLHDTFRLTDSVIMYLQGLRNRKVADNFKVLQLIDDDIPKDISQYNTTKVAGEGVVRSLCETFKVDNLNIYSGTLYGKFQTLDKCIPKIVCDMISNTPIVIQDRAITIIHVDDIVEDIANAYIFNDDTMNTGWMTTEIAIANLIALTMDTMLDCEAHESFQSLLPEDQRQEITLDGFNDVYIQRITEIIMWYHLILPTKD